MPIRQRQQAPSVSRTLINKEAILRWIEKRQIPLAVVVPVLLTVVTMAIIGLIEEFLLPF